MADGENINRGEVLVECLICYQEFKNKNLDVSPLPSGDEDSEELKRVLCVALRIKIGRKYSSDRLFLCRKCEEIVTKLKDIDHELQRLENSFKEKAESLRKLITEGAKAKKGAFEEDDDDDIAVHVRRQVVGISSLSRGSRSKKKDPKEDYIAATTPCRKTKKTEKLKTTKILPVSTDALRRSKRNVGKASKPSVCKNSKECEDPNQEDLGKVFSQVTIKTDTPDSDYFDNGYIPDCPDIGGNAEHRVKSEVEVKQELVSESEPDCFLEYPSKSTNRKARKAKIENDQKAKQKQKRIQIRTIPTKRRRRSKADETTCDSEYMSDTDESRDDVTTDDDETKDQSTSRKWKNDRKERRLWYDGLEVFILEGGYKCSKCDTIIEGDHNYKTRGKMKTHLIVKHLVKYSCVICNKITSCQKYLDQHIRMVHERSVNVPCDICGKPFTSVNAMRRHKWNHQSEEEKKAAIAAGKRQYGTGKLRLLVCKTCGKLCKGPYNLKRHEETHVDQKERQKHMCSFCGSIYSAPESLRSHIKLAHENNNQLQWLQCPHCPKKYPQPGLLDKHMRAHTGEKPFVCEECGAGFSQSNLLKVHILKHKNIRPHKCTDCDMAFYRVYHLRRHREVYHESTNPPTKKQPYRSENGTRKIPQKRKKVSVTLVPTTASVDSTVSEDASNPKVDTHTTESVEESTPPLHQMPIGPENTQENFDFVPTEGSFPYNTYAFTASADSQD